MNWEEIARLEGHVQDRLNGRIHRLRVLVRDDGLVLQGHVHTYYAKQLVQQAVMEASPLPIRANEIEVCRTNEIHYDDGSIMTRKIGPTDPKPQPSKPPAFPTPPPRPEA